MFARLRARLLDWRPPTRFFQDRIQLEGWEIHLARLLLAWIFWHALPRDAVTFTSQPEPVGLGHWIDFTWLANPSIFHPLLLAAKVGVILFALGIAMPLSLGVVLLLDISHNTLVSCQGFQGHGGQIVGLTMLAMLAGHLVFAMRQRSWRSLLYSGARAGQIELRYARAMFAATYIVAGLSKIYYGGWDWWTRGGCFVIQVAKAQDEMLFTHQTVQLSDSAVSTARFLEAHPGVVTPMLLVALLMELGAFLACTTRLRALLVGGALFTFHKLNGWLMGLAFLDHCSLLIILYLMPAYWVVWAVRRIFGLFTRRAKPAAAPEPASMASPPASRRLAWSRFFLAPSFASIVLAFFMLWRGEWYPFSNFPMYAILPPGTVSIYATDMNDQPLPFADLETTAPTIKKMLNVELRKLKANGTVMRMSHLTDEHWREATATVINRLRETWNNQPLRETSFKLYSKSYEAGDRVSVTLVQIGSFPAQGQGPRPAVAP